MVVVVGGTVVVVVARVVVVATDVVVVDVSLTVDVVVPREKLVEGAVERVVHDGARRTRTTPSATTNRPLSARLMPEVYSNIPEPNRGDGAHHGVCDGQWLWLQPELVSS